MTPPLFLVDPLPSEDLVTLDGPEGRHAATVRRLTVGEQLILGDGRGAVRAGVVREVGRDSLVVACAAVRHEPAPVPRLVVVQALAKGERDELAVQLMTELGVAEVVPWAAMHSVVRWQGERGERSRRRWQSAAREAAKQSRRAWVPEVAALHSTAEVAARIASPVPAFVLHESAPAPLTAARLPAAEEMVLVVGPEGGLAASEVAAFEAAGARAVRLGRGVLRTSTAGAAALALLAARLGLWD